MNRTPYEIAFEKGMAIGIERERREFFRELLEEQFGPLPAAVLERVEQLPLDCLATLRRAVLKAKCLSDLDLQE